MRSESFNKLSKPAVIESAEPLTLVVENCLYLLPAVCV